MVFQSFASGGALLGPYHAANAGIEVPVHHLDGGHMHLRIWVYRALS